MFLSQGYDVADYEEIHKPYGIMADVDNLIAELHKRGMKLVMDLVVNHTSDQVVTHLSASLIFHILHISILISDAVAPLVSRV